MKSWYDTHERQAALKAEAAAWLGTPFFTNGRAKGHAVDCHNLAYALHRATGAIPAFELPRGSGRIGDQLRIAKMSLYLSTRPELIEVPIAEVFREPEPEFAVGDLVTFRVVSGEYHMGTWLGAVNGQCQTIVTVARHTGVAYANLFDPTWSRRVVAVWRILHEDER